MTPRHYLGSIKDDRQLDPQFKSLLRYHWIEEAQHVKLDMLMIEAFIESLGAREREKAVEEYIEVVKLLDRWLVQQVEYDMNSLMRAIGRALPDAARKEFGAVQHQANRWTYLGSGMTHESFLTTLDAISPTARARVESLALEFC